MIEWDEIICYGFASTKMMVATNTIANTIATNVAKKIFTIKKQDTKLITIFCIQFH